MGNENLAKAGCHVGQDEEYAKRIVWKETNVPSVLDKSRRLSRSPRPISFDRSSQSGRDQRGVQMRDDEGGQVYV